MSTLQSDVCTEEDIVRAFIHALRQIVACGGYGEIKVSCSREADGCIKTDLSYRPNRRMKLRAKTTASTN